MTANRLGFSVLAACLTGVLQIYFGFAVFGLIINSALPVEWLYELGLRGLHLTITIACIDLVIAILIAIPAAFLLLRLKPHKPMMYAVIATVTGFILTNGSLLFDPTPLTDYWILMISGWLNVVLPIPVAVLLLQIMTGPKSPEKPGDDDTGFKDIPQLST